MKDRPNSNYVLRVMRDDMGAGDEWGVAISWAFACAETLAVLGAEVPALDWQPSPFVRVATPDSFYPEAFETMFVWEYLDAISEVWDADTEARIKEVQQACKILDRYLGWLVAAGKDY